MCGVGVNLSGCLDSGVRVLSGLKGIWHLMHASSGNVVDAGLIFLSTCL